MKNRNGFVSNSSSSSFILEVNGWGNISKVAPCMLDVVIEDFSDWDDSVDKKSRTAAKKQYAGWKKRLAKVLKRKDVQNGEIGVTFPSCNYETYIIQKDNKIYISTCNNHMWNLDGARNYDETEMPQELIIENTIADSMFFDISHNFIHSKEIENEGEKETCPKCKESFFTYVVTPEGKKICGQCFEGDLGKSVEKQLEELKEKNRKKQQLTSYMELDDK